MTIIGEISYTNILPYFYHLDRQRLLNAGCEFVPKVPSQLNKTMASGQVDVGGISSFEYAVNRNLYTLLPDLSVCSYGNVGSIFLFSRIPLHQLSGKQIALTSSSATSVHLLKIILEHFLEQKNDYATMAPSIEEMLASHDACLLIGDDAIKASWNNKGKLYQYDLGQLWYKHTGLPMVYAVFAVRNELVETNPVIVQKLYQAFLMSKDKSIALKHKPMIQEIIKTIGGASDFWQGYFSGLCYKFSRKEQEGLLYYYQLAYECGYLSKQVETIDVWGSVQQ